MLLSETCRSPASEGSLGVLRQLLACGWMSAVHLTRAQGLLWFQLLVMVILTKLLPLHFTSDPESKYVRCAYNVTGDETERSSLTLLLQHAPHWKLGLSV